MDPKNDTITEQLLMSLQDKYVRVQYSGPKGQFNLKGKLSPQWGKSMFGETFSVISVKQYDQVLKSVTELTFSAGNVQKITINPQDDSYVFDLCPREK